MCAIQIHSLKKTKTSILKLKIRELHALLYEVNKTILYHLQDSIDTAATHASIILQYQEMKVSSQPSIIHVHVLVCVNCPPLPGTSKRDWPLVYPNEHVNV